MSTHLDTVALPVHPVTLNRLVRSEWMKLTTLRAATIPLLVAALVIVGLGVAVTAGYVADRTPPAPGIPAADVAVAAASAFDRPLTGVLLAQLLVAAVGAVAATSEYATGMVRTSVLVSQHRGRLLLAKAVVVAGAAALVCGVAVAVAFTLGSVLLARVGLASSPTDPDVLAALLATVASLTGTAVIGVAVGVLLRSGAGAICTVLGGFFVAPLLLPLLPSDGLGGWVQRGWVSQATANTVDLVPHDGALAAAPGAVVFTAWVLALLAAAVLAFRRRDV